MGSTGDQIGSSSKRPFKGPALGRRFPAMLHRMLCACMGTPDERIVAWSPDGKSFIVKDREKFVATILPRFCKQTKYKSFQRQLCLWGFESLNGGKHDESRGGTVIFHQKLLRDDDQLCREIVLGEQTLPRTDRSSCKRGPADSSERTTNRSLSPGPCTNVGLPERPVGRTSTQDSSMERSLCETSRLGEPDRYTLDLILVQHILRREQQRQSLLNDLRLLSLLNNRAGNSLEGSQRVPAHLESLLRAPNATW